MTDSKKSCIIYGDGPFIEDMGVLTTLCLLHDEVLLFGSKPLKEHLDEYWGAESGTAEGDVPSIVEQTFRDLYPEGVVSFLAPSEVSTRFPGADDMELPGVEGVQPAQVNGKDVLMIKTDPGKLNELSKLILRGVNPGIRTARDLLRETSMIGAAHTSGIPIVTQRAQINLLPSSTRVAEAATFIAHRTLQRLALPELRAYDAGDILEARAKLKDELAEFKAGLLELVWALHQKSDLGGDFRELSHQCDILIETKISSAVSQLERAVANHESMKIRRMLITTGAALLELGKALLTPGYSSALLGGSGAVLEIAKRMETPAPTMQVASFIYRVREKR